MDLVARDSLDNPCLVYPDHSEKCFLQKHTVPAWCTCDTYKEHRIRTVVDVALGRQDDYWAGPYYDQLQSGELREALRRIREVCGK